MQSDINSEISQEYDTPLDMLSEDVKTAIANDGK
jgi:hypothetical protein